MRALALALLLAGFGLAGADVAEAARAARASVRPGVARLGERVVYRGEVVAGAWEQVDFLPPEGDPELAWGARVLGRSEYRYRGRRPEPDARGRRRGIDTFWVEIPLQVFATGPRTIPGLRVEHDPDPNDDTPATQFRLPQVRLVIAPTLTAADSDATLREVHGPLAAPWWERVPWRWVLLALLALAAVAWLVRRLRRRKAAPPVAAPVRAAPRSDPLTEALAELRALRDQGLPEAGQFAEHAFRLGRILRRFLERTVVTARPGDTTPELVAHLELADLEAADVQRLAGLLRAWDRVKFAREPVTAAEAHRAEQAVEAFVRAAAGPRREVA